MVKPPSQNDVAPSLNPSDEGENSKRTSSSTSGRAPQEASAHMHQQPNSSLSIREALGAATIHFSDFVNDHLIAARFVTMTTVGILAVYGVTQTPLVFRFRRVSDIPLSYFYKRRWIHGRIVAARFTPTDAMVGRPIPSINTADGDTLSVPSQAILLYVWNMSPIQRLFSTSWFNWLLTIHPTAIVGRMKKAVIRRSSFPENPKLDGIVLKDQILPLDSIADQVLTIQLPAVEAPSHFSKASVASEEWLSQLVQDRTRISCQLLTKKTLVATDTNSGDDYNTKRAQLKGYSMQRLEIVKKRPLVWPSSVTDDEWKNSDQTATMMSNGTVAAIGQPSSSSLLSSSWPTTKHETAIDLAVAKVMFRPKFWSIFSTDLTESMLLQGHARLSTLDGATASAAEKLYVPIIRTSPALLPSTETVAGNDEQLISFHEKIVDSMSSSSGDRSSTVILQTDGKYWERLSKAEGTAIRESRGMWSDQKAVTQIKRSNADDKGHVKVPRWWQRLYYYVRGNRVNNGRQGK